MSQALTLEEQALLQELVEHNWKQVQKAGGDQNFAEDIIECSHEEFAIYDVFVDETMRFDVDPVEYCGYDNIQEMIQKWKEKKKA